ncbi:MAG: Na(+)-translocating NADH-quinone reductase subunit C [Gammaproteobacteria bacterium]
MLKNILSLPNDDPKKIITVAVALCLVCSLVVSAAAVGLRPLQEANEAAALKREILKAAQLYQPGVDVDAEFDKLEAHVVDLASGDFVDSINATEFDARAAADDPDQNRVLSGDEDIAKIRSIAQRMPVYLLRDADQQVQSVILPVHGYGLWSTMYGLVALGPDGNTVKQVTFYEQRETAGLGGEVANPKWQKQWVGKKIYGESGEPKFQLMKGGVVPGSPNEQHHVDGLSGATLTSNGVTNMVRFWMGDLGYGPFLKRLREGGV